MTAVVTPGTRDDLARARSLAEMTPFFASEGAARRFVELALPGPWPTPRGRTLRCVDMGGGEGIVASALAEEARRRGVACDVLVVDANDGFLAAARARGLRTLHGDTSGLPDESVDLLLLRFVNHYQDATTQRALAAEVARILAADGVLAAQIQTGPASVCVLFDEVASWLSGDPPGRGRHWATLPEFIEQFESNGLRRTAVIGADVPDEAATGTLIDEAWTRVHGDALQSSLRRGDAVEAAALMQARQALRKRARERTRELGLGERLATYQPIVVMCKT